MLGLLVASCFGFVACETVVETSVGSLVGKCEHIYKESVVIEATCLTEGKKSYTCSKCSDTYTAAYNMAVYTPDMIYNKASKAVGEIITYNKFGKELALGTGVVYSDDGQILTNYHVIEDAYSAKITLGRNTYDVKQVLAYDKKIDLAILKIEASGFLTLPICAEEVQVGRPAYALGSSKGMTATFSQGIITYANREMDGVTYVQHDAAISSGNSGGPLINEYGEIIGINTWTYKDSQNLNFAIFASEIEKLNFGTPLTMEEFYKRSAIRS